MGPWGGAVWRGSSGSGVCLRAAAGLDAPVHLGKPLSFPFCSCLCHPCLAKRLRHPTALGSHLALAEPAQCCSTLRLQQPGIGCLGHPRVPRGWALIISSFSPPSSYVSPLRYRWKRPPGQLGEPSLGRESRGCSEGWKHAGHCWGAHCPGEVLQNGQGYGKGGGKQQLDCRAGDHMPALLHPAGARKNPPTKNCSSASGHGISGKKKIMHSSFSCDVFSLFFGYRP